MWIDDIATRHEYTILDTSVLLPEEWHLSKRHAYMDQLSDMLERYPRMLTAGGVPEQFALKIPERDHAMQATAAPYCRSMRKLFNRLRRKAVARVSGDYMRAVERAKDNERREASKISPVAARVIGTALEYATKGSTALCASDRALCKVARAALQTEEASHLPKDNLGIFVFVYEAQSFMSLEDYEKEKERDRE